PPPAPHISPAAPFTPAAPFPPAAPFTSAAPFASRPPPAPPPPPQPPPPPAPKYVSKLSLDQLAALRAELALAPEAEHAETRLRFGLDGAAYIEEEAHWQKRFAQDKTLFQTYVQRFQYFRALLRR